MYVGVVHRNKCILPPSAFSAGRWDVIAHMNADRAHVIRESERFRNQTPSESREISTKKMCATDLAKSNVCDILTYFE